MSRKIEVSDLNSKIDALLQIASNNIGDLVMANSTVNSIWNSIKDRVDREQVTQEECANMVAALAEFHQAVGNIYSAGISAHVQMSNVRPGNINEGGKCWPPGSDC